MSDESVFPVGLIGAEYSSDGRPDEWLFKGGGLTKRELLAAMAMQGMTAGLTAFRQDCENIIVNRPRDVAEICVVYADALLAELAKDTP